MENNIDLKSMLEYTKELNVLYVEDDRLIREETSVVFEKFFKKVFVANDGHDGLESYKSFKEDSGSFYDLVISDINMPNMNGIEMIQEIEKINSDQSVIVISAHNETEYVVPLIECGVDSFLLKPIDVGMVIKVINKVCKQIHDRKAIIEHAKQIEKLNSALEEKNRKLEDSVRKLESFIYTEQVKEKQRIKSDTSVESTKFDNGTFDYVSDDFPEIIDIYDEVDTIFTNLSTQVRKSGDLDKDSLAEAIKKLKEYSLIISKYPTFYDLSEKVMEFSDTLGSENFPEDKESLENIFMLIENLMLMIYKWQNEWKSGEVDKVGFFYKSAISDIETIIKVFNVLKI